MRNRRSKEVVVNQPGKGLLTNLPPDLQDNKAGQYVVSAKNVRAEDGQLKSAPGYERIHLDPSNLESAANLIHQTNLTGDTKDQRKIPIVGTEGRLYAVSKRSRPLVCPYGCGLVFGAIGDSGKVGVNQASVAGMVRSWNPGLVIHAGDLVYADGGSGTSPDEDPYESQVARYWSWAFGAYGGEYPAGENQIFFPAMGNHDWDDGPGARYLEFFSLPGNERFYDIKRGPIHFFYLDSYGYGPTSTGPNGDAIDGTGAADGVGQADLSSTGPMATWLKLTLANSDCPIRVVVLHHPPATSEVNYYPGYAVLDWPFGEWGADLLITGHSHCYERILRSDGVTQVTVGTGGHSLRGFSLTPVSGSQARVSEYGALRGTAVGNVLTLEFIGVDLAVKDSVVISPNRSLTVCYSGEVSQQVRRLEIRPAAATLAVGQTFPFDAVVKCSDGTTELVTSKAEWASVDTGVASVDRGAVTGVAMGTTTVQAHFEGLGASSQVTVEASCTDTPLDLVVLFDRSLSMGRSGTFGRTRISRAKEGLGLMFDRLDRNAGDRLALVHFGGDWKTQTSDVVRVSGLTEDYAAVDAEASKLVPSGDTGIAAAFVEAKRIFSEQHREGYRKTVLLFTDGVANVLDGNDLPDATGPGNWATLQDNAMGAVTTLATELKADDDALVIVIALDLARYPSRKTVVTSWATPGYYYDAGDTDQLVELFATILQDVCKDATSGEGLGVGLGNL